MKLAPANEKLVRDLGKLLRPDQVSAADSHRLSYGRDSNSKAMLWVRQGEVKFPPSAVAWPETSAEVAKVAAFANDRGLPLIPFGGGSGVCGGTWAIHGGIALDMKRMNRILKVNTQTMELRAQTGINGELLERELQRRSLTLGHFPSSIYVATLGGYLACRSAGQFSSRYGKIEDMVEAIEVVLADGEIAELSSVKDCPKALDLKELFLGSEGTLGIMTEATLKVHSLPEKDLYWGFQFPNLEAGLKAMRKLMQSGLKPSVLRLYDELDTKIFLSHGEEEVGNWWQSLIGKRTEPLFNWTKELSLKWALKNPALLRTALGLLPRACLMILGFQGKTEEVIRWAKQAGAICVEARGKDLGERPGRRWLEHRYSVSYKLSPLFDAGYFADTMEVATTWGRLGELYDSIRRAIGRHGLAMAHFSHAYAEGCSIYFTFIAFRESEAENEKLYGRIWREALKACVAAGGTISHHHGVGLLKGEFMPAEWGQAWPWLKSMKARLDPRNILNPGKLGFADA